MATMVKEKKKSKKKPKENQTAPTNLEEEISVCNKHKEIEEAKETASTVKYSVETALDPPSISTENPQEVSQKINIQEESVETCENASKDVHTTTSSNKLTQNISAQSNILENETSNQTEFLQNKEIESQKNIEKNVYEELNSKLDSLTIPNVGLNVNTKLLEERLKSPDAYLKQGETSTNITSGENTQCLTSHDLNTQQQNSLEQPILAENVAPSAPVFEEEIEYHQREFYMKTVIPKPQSMPLQEAKRVFGGREMEEIRVMAEREEALVEAGPVSGPEHPLVDLLSTFSSSLRAVDRERTKIACSFTEEEKFRNTIWKIEKRKIYLTEKCPCGSSVVFQGLYEHAELQQDRLPVARMKLFGLLTDVKDCYCHHQHAALLAHCQIEQLITEITQSNKAQIREALALILQALRMCAGPDVLATTLQRWAAVSAAALVDHRDVRQLLHLLQHLFRQSRTVRWATQAIKFNVTDMSSAAQAVAILDLLLTKPKLDTAQECTEEEVWEEVDRHGSGSAVCAGSLRESCLLAALRACPVGALIATLCLFANRDLNQARPQDWGDFSNGRNVLKSCCGIRTLLSTFERAISLHSHYKKLHQYLRELTSDALHCLASLHLHSQCSYATDIADKIAAELEAAFTAGFTILSPHDLHKLPAGCISEDLAKEYCISIINGLHDKSPKQVPGLDIELPVLSCEARVKIIAQAALDRTYDHELARVVMEFLLQTSLKKKPVDCKGTCNICADVMLPKLFAAHPYLHTLALHVVADLYHAELFKLDSISMLSLPRWRPTTGEIRAVLEDWQVRCAPLIPKLLLAMDYTPHSGVSLEVQLTIGTWLCHHQQPNTPEWAWLVLRRISVHRATWGLPLHVSDPEEQPRDLFGSAYAVLSSSWGHCVPLICTSGVSALCRLAATRPREAVHCLSPVMAVMAQSPESVSHTPQFLELFTALLNSGPTVVQRALGFGPVPGSELLLRVILRQLDNQYPGVCRTSLLSAWLHALWRCSLHYTAYSILDTALLACREWLQFDSHAGLILQDASYKDHISSAVRNGSTAPLLCECLLRNAHAHKEVLTGVNARLLDVLHLQRVNNERIHVDNALKKIGANISSEDLAIYKTATAVSIAPHSHPSHLTLWRLLIHLYLQRPPCSMYETTPPAGPLFFSGVIKSRVLTQLRNKLTETAKYHRNEIETLKSSQSDSSQSINQSENVPTRPRIDKPSVDDTCVLPELTIHDLTGELSDDSDTEGSGDEKSEDDDGIRGGNVEGVRKIDVKQLIGYHVAAEKMILEFSRWLEEGDKVRAMPHHADIARFIPERALEAAWNSELSRRRPPPDQPELPLPPRPAPPPRAPLTPFVNARRRLICLQRRSNKRKRTPSLKSPIENLNFRDTRQILKEVDRHLSDIDKLSREWSNEVNRVATLDAQLWELVTALRVPQSMPAVKKACANKCRPVTFHIAEREWCISPGAERGIVENRRAARMALRRVAVPRREAASGAAAILAIARHVNNLELARAILERTWLCAGSVAVSECAYAHDVLVTLVETLADRWISQDGVLCASLISHWCKRETTALQQALIGGIVQPRRLQLADWSSVYKALLKARLPSNAMFSYLSKFEMTRCSQTLDAHQRRELLDTLLEVAQRWGISPDEEHCVLLELIGVHTAALLNAHELSAHVMLCSRASIRLSMPPAFWTYIVTAANTHAVDVSFDQLGHLLRELGMVWWDARLALKGRTEPRYAEYAPHMAELLKSLHTAFVTNAVNMSYAMERVAVFAWSAAQESWCAWIGAHAHALPLLDHDALEEMLQHFIDHLLVVLARWPGIENHLLRQVFEWVIQNYMNVNTTQLNQESRVQMSALLGKLANLPWDEYQWAHPTCLQVALQISTTNDKEILSWCSATWRNITAETWLQGVSDEQLAPTLATILYAYSVAMTQHTQALEEATRLPWWRFPEIALHEALDRFFAHHHNPAQPYHDLPQFKLILFASELSIHQSTPPQIATSQTARNKRAHAVSAWTRAACSPALGAHVPAHCTRLLATITLLAPQIECSVGDGEIEELLGRAVIIMCIEPAAASALPVWQRWVRSAPPRLISASLTAVAALTTFDYFAGLADDVVRAHIACPETADWSEMTARWSNCHWSDMSPLVSRGRLHAAYAVSRAHDTSHGCRAAYTALSHVTVNAVENEAILAVWICYTCRIARISGDTDEGTECREAALLLLRKWAEEPRMSLLRVLSVDTARPTQNHRLLSRLALCILTPSDSAVKAYEAACLAVLGSSPGDVLQWGKQPHAKRLPRLAVRLFPNCDRYFKDELDLADD